MDREFENLVLLIDSLGPEDPLGPNAYSSSTLLHDQGARSTRSIRSTSDGSARESETPITETTQYQEMRLDGRACQRMLSNSDLACPIPRSTLTLADLDPEIWLIDQRPVEGLPASYRESDMDALELPTRGFRNIIMDAWRPDNAGIVRWLGCWKGRVAPGVIFLEHIVRKEWGPWSSELCKVAYEQVAHLSTLRTVFVCHVINSDTRPFARGISPGPELKTFTCGSAAYQTFLGTRIGKVVAYFILCAFGQGVKRIARIAVWWVGAMQNVLQLRFDIEDARQEDNE